MMAFDVAATLLEWYDRNARVLPWRSPPGTLPPSPYRVWLSEVMLQQTGTAVVAPYYARFSARWPSVEALAAADDAEVMREWAGLGYYARARNLLACARAVVARGGWPGDEAGLRALPGVGGYTAAAVAAIAFEQCAVVVDGNVQRVVARLFAVEQPLPGARPTLYDLAATLTPGTRAGDFAQAMMDLGATACSPRNPKCETCPLATECAARASGDPSRFPVKAAKAVKPVRVGTAWWIEVDGWVLLERRPARGLLGGMLGLPGSEWARLPEREGSGVGAASKELASFMHLPTPDPSLPGRGAEVATVRHVFTHFELRLTVVVACPATRPDLPGEWHRIATVASAGLPTLFARAADAVLHRRAHAAQSPQLALETV